MRNRAHIFFIFLAFTAISAFLCGGISGAAEGQLSNRELNLQNAALNACEDFMTKREVTDPLYVNDFIRAQRKMADADECRLACQLNPNYKRVRGIFDKKRADILKHLMDTGMNVFASQDYEKAVRYFEQALLIDPGNANAKDKQALCKEMHRKVASSRERLHDQGVTISTLNLMKIKEAQGLLEKGRQYLAKRWFTEAIKVFNEGLNLDPMNIEFYRQIEKAQNLYEISLESRRFNSHFAEFSIAAARPSEKLADFDKRVKRLSDSCEAEITFLDKRDPAFRRRMEALEETVFARHANSVGKYHFMKGRYKKAEDALTRCLEFPSEKNDANYTLALMDYQNQQFRESYKRFKSIYFSSDSGTELRSKTTPYYWKLLFNLYKYVFLTIIFQMAVTASMVYKSWEIVDFAFDKVLTRLKNFQFHDANYYFENGMAYFNKANYSKAIGYLAKCSAMDKTNISAAYSLGVCYFKTGKLDLARPGLENILRVSPNHQRAAYYLAIIYDSVKLQKDAIRMLEIARGINTIQRNFSMLEIEKNRQLYLGTFQNYKESADKILGLNEQVIAAGS